MEAARALAAVGIDAIEVSGGTSASGDRSPARGRAKSPAEEGYHRPLAQRIKEVVACPVLVVGGFRSRAVVEETLETGGGGLYRPGPSPDPRTGFAGPLAAGESGGCRLPIL
ncbi:MAG: hypothetical protein H7836_07490 [Magnetococcus sp. YQC-3]